MGGQACILYGAAEFSRDLDLLININKKNIEGIQEALKGLEAETIFVPELNYDVLNRGHSCHFRCHIPEANGLRIDLMSKMRGCSRFDELWQRRTIIELPDIGELGLLSLPDLVQSKKTQREKDWVMIRRLIEIEVTHFKDNPTEKQIRFWILECRTPNLLVYLTQRYPDICSQMSDKRKLLFSAQKGNVSEIEYQLIEEENKEKEADRNYWLPLKKELEKWRRKIRQ
jgi:hypothetical protein